MSQNAEEKFHEDYTRAEVHFTSLLRDFATGLNQRGISISPDVFRKFIQAAVEVTISDIQKYTQERKPTFNKRLKGGAVFFDDMLKDLSFKPNLETMTAHQFELLTGSKLTDEFRARDFRPVVWHAVRKEFDNSNIWQKADPQKAKLYFLCRAIVNSFVKSALETSKTNRQSSNHPSKYVAAHRRGITDLNAIMKSKGVAFS